MTTKLRIISTHRADYGHLWPLHEAARQDNRFDSKFINVDEVGDYNWVEPGNVVVFLQGDRTELLEVAASAIRRGDTIAHAAGGERTKGSTDDLVRDAITKLAHLHYPVHQQAESRLLDLGEEVWRICVAGEIGVDTIVNGKGEALPEDIDAYTGDAVVAVHPVTARPEETKRVLDVVRRYAQTLELNRALWLVTPNGDPGSEEINNAWAELFDNGLARLLPPLTHPQFLTLMKRCGTIIGNSSCLITEAPHLGVLPILIGTRQEGRLQAPSDGNACGKILDHLAKYAGHPRIRVKA